MLLDMNFPKSIIIIVTSATEESLVVETHVSAGSKIEEGGGTGSPREYKEQRLADKSPSQALSGLRTGRVD